MPNIIGNAAMYHDVGLIVGDLTTATGAFLRGSKYNLILNVGSTNSSSYELKLDASKYSSIYKDNAHVKPNSYACQFFIKF